MSHAIESSSTKPWEKSDVAASAVDGSNERGLKNMERTIRELITSGIVTIYDIYIWSIQHIWFMFAKSRVRSTVSNKCQSA